MTYLGIDSPLSSGRGARAVRAAAWLALIIVLVWFAWRGVWRGAHDSVDLTYGFTAAQAWRLGLNPYDSSGLMELLHAAGGTDATGGIPLHLRNVYFPTSLPLWLPISFASWPDARLMGLALDVGAAFFIALGLVHVLGWRPTSTRALGLMAFVLALGPLHLTVQLGQTSVVATAGIVAAMLLQQSGHRVWAGLLYGLATAVKIQLGLPFVAYLLWRRRWATAAAAGLVLAGLTLLSVLQMQIAGVPWLTTWLTNLARLEEVSPNTLINLQYPLESLVGSTELVNLITFVAVGAAATTMVWLIRGRHPRQELLALSIVAVLGLLVTYHRYYDAVLVALPIAWAFSVLGTARWRQGAVVLVLCLDFIPPILGTLITIQGQQFLPPWVTQSVLWEAVLLPLHAWVLVLLVLVLLWAAAQDRRHAPESRAGAASWPTGAHEVRSGG